MQRWTYLQPPLQDLCFVARSWSLFEFLRACLMLTCHTLHDIFRPCPCACPLYWNIRICKTRNKLWFVQTVWSKDLHLLRVDFAWRTILPCPGWMARHGLTQSAKVQALRHRKRRDGWASVQVNGWFILGLISFKGCSTDACRIHVTLTLSLETHTEMIWLWLRVDWIWDSWMPSERWHFSIQKDYTVAVWIGMKSNVSVSTTTTWKWGPRNFRQGYPEEETDGNRAAYNIQ